MFYRCQFSINLKVHVLLLQIILNMLTKQLLSLENVGNVDFIIIMSHVVFIYILHYSLRSGINRRHKHPAGGDIRSAIDTKVVFSPDMKDGNAKTLISDENKASKSSKRNVPSDLRFRSRTGSSGHSSLLDSGHSSQPSSDLTERGSTERIALVELSDTPRKGDFV